MNNPMCPSCGHGPLDLARYDSMMVLSQDVAFFTLRCPYCQSVVSCIGALQGDLLEEAHMAAIKIGAGMGQRSVGE